MSSANKINFSSSDTVHISLTLQTILDLRQNIVEYQTVLVNAQKVKGSRPLHSSCRSSRLHNVIVSKMAKSIEFRWLCVLHVLCGKPVTSPKRCLLIPFNRS